MRRNLDTDMYGRKTIKRHREKTAIYKPRRETWDRFSLPALRRNPPADSLILDF